jgi:hypothetical protein
MSRAQSDAASNASARGSLEARALNYPPKPSRRRSHRAT